MEIKNKNDLAKIFNILLTGYFELHHIDKNRKNNSIDNLIILRKKDHILVHRAIRHGWDILTRNKLNGFLRLHKIKKYMVGEISPKEWRSKKQIIKRR